MNDLLSGFGATATEDTKTIKAWSFSGLRVFETCEEHARLKYIEREPEPERDDNAANERGKRIHDNAEKYIRGELSELPKELSKHWEAELNRLREEFAEEPHRFQLEEDWGFTHDWEPTGFFDDNVWCRMKLDVLEFPMGIENHADVIDWKSGKKWGNEVKYTQQGQLYAVGTFMKYPELLSIKTRFLFTDTGEKMERVYSRNQMPPILTNFTQRGERMTTAMHFKPKPSKIACRFCPYGPNGRGRNICVHGVEI